MGGRWARAIGGLASVALVGLALVPMPAQAVGAGSVAVRLTAGWTNSCAITDVGALVCWGNSLSGGGGVPNAPESAVPVPVAGLSSGVRAVASSPGAYTACAVTSVGGLRCWGQGAVGQLGNGGTADSWTPVPVTGLSSGVAEVAVGDGHTCALTTSGGVLCWGSNVDGQLGTGSIPPLSSSVPVAVTGLSSGVAHIAAESQGTCAVLIGGGIRCWGLNYRGSLGIGDDGYNWYPTSHQVVGITSGVVDLTAGGRHACARFADGTARCWGANNGQLGDGTAVDAPAPVQIAGRWTALAAGFENTCGISTTGAALCWGNNTHGQLGNGSVGSQNALLPTPVVGLTSGVTAIAVGGEHACALVGSGAARCWGEASDGQLGHGDFQDSLTSVGVVGLPLFYPSAPASSAAVAGVASATVSWPAPASDGGAPITGFVVTPYADGEPEAPRTFTSTATTQTISGLTGGTSFTFRVAAVNALGVGPQSPPSNPVTPSIAPSGRLRVITSPPVPSQILVDGLIGDSWGLDWVKQPVGPHRVCFTDAPGFTTPPCQDVTVSLDQTTLVTGTFVRRGYLRVTTYPAVGSRITVDGIPRNNWGMWTHVPAGSHQVCFGPVSGYTPPACQTVSVTAGQTTEVSGMFTPSTATGLDGVGYLRATSSPAVGTQISVDGEIADSWGLNWLELPAGAHVVCFGRVEGWTGGGCATVQVSAGQTTTYSRPFEPRTWLIIDTDPPVAGTIFVDGAAADDWGVYTDWPSGPHHVCFGAVPGYVTPRCVDEVLTPVTNHMVTGRYEPT